MVFIVFIELDEMGSIRKLGDGIVGFNHGLPP